MVLSYPKILKCYTSIVFLFFISYLNGQFYTQQTIVTDFNFEQFNVNQYSKLKKNAFEIKLHNNVKYNTCETKTFELFYNNHKVSGCGLTIIQNQNKNALISLVLPDSLSQFNSSTLPFECWKNKGEIWHPCTIKIIPDKTSSNKSIQFINVNSNKIIEEEPARIWSKKDSTVSLGVFLPDPLSAVNRTYSFPYTDRKDSSYAQILSEIKFANAKLLFNNDSFFLVDNFIRFAEVSLPNTAIPTFKTNAISSTRNNTSFEYINSFYHLQNVRNYWTKLGLNYIADTVVVDPHALDGADESSFDPTHIPPALEFGDGGVDDAEDADAIVHEYTHAACNKLVKGGYSGNERKTIEEGICDYSAAVYSLLFTTNFKGQVYNWDGHNEYWEGRTLINTRKYPSSLTGQIHVDGQIFGGALWDLGERISHDSALKLLFLAVPAMLPNISMKQAAKIIIQTDSIIFSGKYAKILDEVFYTRGLWVSKLNVHSINSKYQNLKLNYSNQQLSIFSSVTTSFEIYNAAGQSIYLGKLAIGKNQINLPLNDGIYILKSFQNSVVKFVVEN